MNKSMTAPPPDGSSFMPHLYCRGYYENLSQLHNGEHIEVAEFPGKKNLAKFAREVVSTGLNIDAGCLYKVNERELTYIIERLD